MQNFIVFFERTTLFRLLQRFQRLRPMKVKKLMQRSQVRESAHKIQRIALQAAHSRHPSQPLPASLFFSPIAVHKGKTCPSKDQGKSRREGEARGREGSGMAASWCTDASAQDLLAALLKLSVPMASSAVFGARVAVVDGSIGGLVAAACLRAAGFSNVQVFERSAGLQPGARIGVSDASMAILKGLGVLGCAEKQGTLPYAPASTSPAAPMEIGDFTRTVYASELASKTLPSTPRFEPVWQFVEVHLSFGRNSQKSPRY